MTLADQTIAALRSGHDDLAALVRKLGPDELTAPSAASEWQISQVLSHLGSGAEIGLATLTAAQQGGSPPDLEFNKGIWARWDAMAPAEHANGFLESNQRLVEAYEALDAGTRESLQVNLGFLPQPLDVATAARFRLSEFALHQWDVVVAFEPGATVAADAAPLLLDQTGFMLGWLSKPEAYTGEPARIAVRLTAPEREFGLSIGEKVELTDTPESPDGTLTLPTEAWLRLTTGRLKDPYVPDSVTVTGPVSLDDLRRVFPGF